MQLIEDIKGCIESGIIDARIQTTARVQRIAEGVDIEVTLHLTRHNVCGLVQRTGSLLVTMAALGGQLHRQVLQDIVRGIGIKGIAVHLTSVDILARVVHQRERQIGLRLLCTIRY